MLSKMTAVTEVKALTEEQIAQLEITVAEEFAGFSADSAEHLLLDSEVEKLTRRYSDTDRVVIGSHSYDPDKKSYMEISGSGSTTVIFDEKDNARIRTVGSSRHRSSWGPEDDRYKYVFEVVAEAARRKRYRKRTSRNDQRTRAPFLQETMPGTQRAGLCVQLQALRASSGILAKMEHGSMRE